jgi:hypothetical protein
LKTFLESNSFDYVSIEVLSQKENDDHIKSIIYFFKTLSFAECNYEIYDKELLTIIRCFEQWRAELESVEKSINVLTDHKSLEYFMIIKKLNKRQTKWAKFLAEFDFKITYQSKKRMIKRTHLLNVSKIDLLMNLTIETSICIKRFYHQKKLIHESCKNWMIRKKKIRLLNYHYSTRLRQQIRRTQHV